jgi:hypothetical protein
MRADSADGNSDWSLDRPIIDAGFHSDSNLLVYPSLSEVDGHPAVTCHNQDALFGGDALYIRASNAQGTIWPIAARTIVYVEDHVAFLTALGEVNDRPAMAYIGGLATGNWIRFVRSYDAEGTNWPQVPVDLTPIGDFRLSGSSFEIVSGYPAVACWSTLDTQVFFVRALDADGMEWGQPVPAASAADVQASLDLAIVNGLPCIAYRDPAGLYLAVAASFAGDEWNAPVLVDSGSLVGISVKLADIEGRAGLAYYNHLRQNIEFVVYR